MNSDFEVFSVYGFSINYPKDCWIEFNPKSRRPQGDLVFHFEDRHKIFVSWGDLQRALKSFRTVEEHADHTLKVLEKGGSVRNFERVSQETMTIYTHKGVFNLVRLVELRPGILPGKKSLVQEGFSVHVHCSEANRYFVIYSVVPSDLENEPGATFTKIARSLKCH